MADSFVQVQPDSTGKKIQCYQNTVATENVQVQAVVLVNSTGTPISLPTSGLRWVVGRDVPFDEWNELINSGTIISIVTLPTGSILYDVIFVGSDDYNDNEASSGGIERVGWGHSSPPNFAYNFPTPKDVAGVDFLWTLRGPATSGLRFGRYEYGLAFNDPGNATLLTGRPVIITDSNTAGPLQCFTGALAGDATAGSIAVWLLIESEVGSL